MSSVGQSQGTLEAVLQSQGTLGRAMQGQGGLQSVNVQGEATVACMSCTRSTLLQQTLESVAPLLQCAHDALSSSWNQLAAADI